jgi:hypothetical protein
MTLRLACDVVLLRGFLCCVLFLSATMRLTRVMKCFEEVFRSVLERDVTTRARVMVATCTHLGRCFELFLSATLWLMRVMERFREAFRAVLGGDVPMLALARLYGRERGSGTREIHRATISSWQLSVRARNSHGPTALVGVGLRRMSRIF